jgi:hypothetical protein
MPSVLESLSSMITPDMVGALGKAFGAEPAAVSRGLEAVGPLMMDSMAKMAGTPAGAESLLKMLPADGSGLLGGFGNIGSLVSSLMGGASSGNSLASSLLGPGINAIGGALSKALGFNVMPLIGMIAPAILGVVGKAVQSGKLDAGGLAAMLQKENAAITADPAKQDMLALVSTAMAAGDKAASTINAYGADWSKVAAAPVAAMLAVSSSDLDGPFDTMKEVKAAQAALFEAARAAPASSVMAAAFGGGLTESALKSVRQMAKEPGALTRLIADATAAVKQRSPGEVDAFRDAIRAIGKATAEAAKEGGFLGIGGTLVSDDEKAALAKIETALA